MGFFKNTGNDIKSLYPRFVYNQGPDYDGTCKTLNMIFDPDVCGHIVIRTKAEENRKTVSEIDNYNVHIPAQRLTFSVPRIIEENHPLASLKETAEEYTRDKLWEMSKEAISLRALQDLTITKYRVITDEFDKVVYEHERFFVSRDIEYAREKYGCKQYAAAARHICKDCVLKKQKGGGCLGDYSIGCPVLNAGRLPKDQPAKDRYNGIWFERIDALCNTHEVEREHTSDTRVEECQVGYDPKGNTTWESQGYNLKYM